MILFNDFTSGAMGQKQKKANDFEGILKTNAQILTKIQQVNLM